MAGDEIRVSDDDREAVVKQLGDAMAEGRIDVAEYETRSRTAYAAKVPSELDALVVDLPGDRNLPAVASSSPPATTASSRKWSIALFGDRRVQAAVGRETVAVSVFGDQIVEVPPGADGITIRSYRFFGDLKVRAPDQTAIEIGGFTLFGDVREQPEPAAPTARVRIEQFGLFGDAIVQ